MNPPFNDSWTPVLACVGAAALIGAFIHSSTTSHSSNQKKSRNERKHPTVDIESMLFGVAVGDAFGVGIEFKCRDWIQQNVDFTKYVNERTGNLAINYKPGMYSDDTEMTIGYRNLTK